MWRLTLFGLSFLAVSLYAESSGGLQTAVSGDLVGRFSDSQPNRFEPREAEVFFFAPIDQLFNGVVSAAAHNEEGEFTFEIHELFVGSSSLIPRSRFRLGKFFLGIGRLGQFHRHDWPFISAPLIHQELFGDENLNDAGLEYSYLFPLPFYLDLTLGVTNGWNLQHAHTEGVKPLFPTHYAHLVTYWSGFGSTGTQFGLSYLGRRQADGAFDLYLGFDSTTKWQDGRVLTGLLQSEFWYRSLETTSTVEGSKTYGFYVYPQIAMHPQWWLGLRLEGISRPSEKYATGVAIPNFDYAVVPTLSFKASEFSTFRLAYSYNGGFHDTPVSPREKFVELQALFILGAHPAHDF